jgi:DNA-directed RNA polymerase specialized sigma24 family protein
VTLDETHVTVDEFAAELLDLNDALERLAKESPRMAAVVEYRFFGGLSNSEAAEALDVSERTVKYDWAMARAWLQRALEGEDPEGGADRAAPRSS